MSTPACPGSQWTSSPLPSSAWPKHGGQAETLLTHFGLPADHRLDDFSANLNPLGPPAWVRDWLTRQLAGLDHYPAPDYPAARQAIAAHHQLQKSINGSVTANKSPNEPKKIGLWILANVLRMLMFLTPYSLVYLAIQSS